MCELGIWKTCTKQRGLYAMTVEMVGSDGAADVMFAVSRSRGEGVRATSESLKLHDIASGFLTRL